MEKDSIFVEARLNGRLMPIQRGTLFEDPLAAALEEKGYGTIDGGGTQMAANGEIAYCDLGIQLSNFELGLPFVQDFLINHGAPKGSILRFKVEGEPKEIPIGTAEGLALYLNGTDLPDETYQTCDINFVISELSRLLDNQGAILSFWEGPSETALYLYGPSFEEMSRRIDSFVKEYPLCHKSRIMQIA